MAAEPSSTTPKLPGGPRAVAFAITWVAYASYYLGRKGVGVVKARIVDDLGKDSLNGVETALLAAYAAGQYISGFVGDRLGARRLLTVGLLVSAVACLAFGFSSAWPLFIVAYVVNGLAQATGWPGTTKAMTEWTTKEDRGRVMGLWSTCYQAGGIIATAVCARAAVAFGWRGAFVVPAVILIVVAILVARFLKPGPRLEAATREVAPGNGDAPVAPADDDAERRADRARLLRSPLLYSYGAAYFCIKLVRYSLIFWLPFYLEKVLHYEPMTAIYLSTAFDVGGLVGTIGLGYISDRGVGIPRATFALVSLVGLALALVLYGKVAALSVTANFAAMALVGLLLFGPDSLVSGAASQDAGGRHSAALATGLVNGIGSLGAILQELVTRGVSARWGWGALFQVFVGLSALSALCLIPAVIHQRRAARAAAA